MHPPTRPAEQHTPRSARKGSSYYINSINPAAVGADAARIRAVWDDATTAPPWDRPPVWVHGDLHPANVITADGTLSGVVDFEDMPAGDPAADVAAAWLLLPAEATHRFFSTYAAADEAMVRRARGHAVLRSLFLMLMGQKGDHGLAGGKPHWGPLGRAALDRILDATPT